MHDYIPQSIFGYFDDIKKHDIFKNTYHQLLKLNWQDTYCCLNVQIIDRIRLPKNCKKVIISFHTEYYNYYALMEFINRNPDCKFLLISDGDKAQSVWPANVTYVQWITWADQLDVAIAVYGVNTGVRNANKKISSMSARHEFHKAAITAYLLNNYAVDDYILSWHDVRYTEPYYLQPGFLIQSTRIQNYIDSDTFKKLTPVSPDGYIQKQNTPILNGKWQTGSYTDCAINLTNESIFNSNFNYNGLPQTYTTPYLTEKTWKPLLARQAFIPVGQFNTLGHLSRLGLNFDYGLDLSFDQQTEDFSRIEGLYRLLDKINEIDTNDLIKQVQPVADFNLNLITSGKFKLNCDQVNSQQLDKIESWLND
jgi:hypothetical protein